MSKAFACTIKKNRFQLIRHWFFVAVKVWMNNLALIFFIGSSEHPCLKTTLASYLFR